MNEEQSQQAQQSVQQDGDKTYTCAKCGKVKKESEGSFMLNGTAFCCEECCKREDHKEGNICEYC